MSCKHEIARTGQKLHIRKTGHGLLFCGLTNHMRGYSTISRIKAEELSAEECKEQNVCEECIAALSAMLANTI